MNFNINPKLTIIAGPAGPDRNKALDNALEQLRIPPEATKTIHGHNLSLVKLYTTLWEIENSGVSVPACLIINDLDFSDTRIKLLIQAATDPVAPFVEWRTRIEVLNKEVGYTLPASFTYSHHVIIVTDKDLGSYVKRTSKASVDVRYFIDRATFVNLYQEDISNLYKNVFSSSDGILVLKDLERIVNQTKIDAQNINPNTAVWKCAQESLLKRIKNQLI